MIDLQRPKWQLEIIWLAGQLMMMVMNWCPECFSRSITLIVSFMFYVWWSRWSRHDDDDDDDHATADGWWATSIMSWRLLCFRWYRHNTPCHTSDGCCNHIFGGFFVIWILFGILLEYRQNSPRHKCDECRKNMAMILENWRNMLIQYLCAIVAIVLR